jgi:hypothetical protein
MILVILAIACLLIASGTLLYCSRSPESAVVDPPAVIDAHVHIDYFAEVPPTVITRRRCPDAPRRERVKDFYYPVHKAMICGSITVRENIRLRRTRKTNVELETPCKRVAPRKGIRWADESGGDLCEFKEFYKARSVKSMSVGGPRVLRPRDASGRVVKQRF